MSTLQTALQEVGFQPTLLMGKPIVAQEIEKLAEYNRTMFNLPARKVQVTYQGGWYRARYAGGSMSTFGRTPASATRALKFWQGGQ